MTRAAAKNHAWVGIVTSPDAVRRACSAELRANDGAAHRRDASTARARGVRPHRRVRRRDRAVARGRRGCSPSTSCSRSSAPTRSSGTARTRTSTRARYRIAGTTSWWDGVEQHSGLALSYLNFYDTDAAWQLVHDLVIDGVDAPTCAIIKHANPCGVAIADDLADRVPARARVRRAVGVRWDRRAEPPARRRDRRPHGGRAASRCRDRAVVRARSDRGARRQAQEHAPARGARARAVDDRRAPDLGWVPRAGAAPLRGGRETSGRSSRSAFPPTPNGATPSSRGGSAGT